MRRPTLNLALCIAVTIMLCSTLQTAVHAAGRVVGNGHITGQLLDGTNKNAPLAGQQVTLQMAQGRNAQDLTTATTAADGAYSFANLATDKTIGYAIYIRYQGAQYVSDVVSLAAKPEQQVNLTVYQATDSSAKLAVVHASLLLHQPDAQRGTITISEIFSFKNLDTHTYVGSLAGNKGKPDALLFSLPAHARAVNLSSSFDGYKVVQVDGGFATDTAVYPGDSEFSFSFDLPYSASTYDLAYTAIYPTVDLSVLVPPDLQATATGLTVQGIVASDQHPYRVFDAKQLLAQQSVHLSLAGLPMPASSSAPTPVNASWIWLLVSLLIMAAIIFVTLLVARSRSGSRRRPSRDRKHDTRARSASQTTDRKQELLQELLKLDESFAAGKLSKAAYQERRAKTKARLRSLIQ